MKDIIDLLCIRGFIFKELLNIKNTMLNNKKRISIFKGVDFNDNYCAIFKVEVISKFEARRVLEVESLFGKLKSYSGHNYKKRIIMMQSCSYEAKRLLVKKGWMVFCY